MPYCASLAVSGATIFIAFPDGHLSAELLLNYRSLLTEPKETALEGNGLIVEGIDDGNDAKQVREKIQAYNGHLEALSERLAQLPATVSSQHIFSNRKSLVLQ